MYTSKDKMNSVIGLLLHRLNKSADFVAQAYLNWNQIMTKSSA